MMVQKSGELGDSSPLMVILRIKDSTGIRGCGERLGCELPSTFAANRGRMLNAILTVFHFDYDAGAGWRHP
jgi:hypothetical protein